MSARSLIAWLAVAIIALVGWEMVEGGALADGPLNNPPQTVPQIRDYASDTYTPTRVFNIVDTAYGAHCAGNTAYDDAPAVGLARTAMLAAGSGTLIVPPGCNFLTTADFTGINGGAAGTRRGYEVDVWDALCQTSGDVCMDFLGSREFVGIVSWHTNASTNLPTIALQYGRFDPAVTADHVTWIYMHGIGTVTDRQIVNYASEGSTIQGGISTNNYTGNTTHAVYAARCNGIPTSHYVTVNWAANTHGSCDNNTLGSVKFQELGTGTRTMDLIDTNGWSLNGTYLSNSNGPNCLVLLDQSSLTGSTQNNSGLHLDHERCESNPQVLTSMMLASADGTTEITGIKVNTPDEQASFAHFGIDLSGIYGTAMTSTILDNVGFEADGVAGAVQSTFTVTGSYFSIATATKSVAGSGCTNGNQLFTLDSGSTQKTAATLTGHITGGTLDAGALTVTTAGLYQTAPANGSTLTGGGCAVKPAVTLTTNTAVAAPMTLGGDVTIPSSNYWTPPATVRALLLCQGRGGASSKCDLNGRAWGAATLQAGVSGDNVVGLGASDNQFKVAPVIGNGSVQLGTGAHTTNNCAKFDASANVVDSGAPCSAAGPQFRIYLGSNQTGVSSAADTKIAFDTAAFDTSSVCDVVTNRRCTPNVAGKYLVTLQAAYTGTLSVGGTDKCEIKKNGTTDAQVISAQIISSSQTVQCVAIVSLNGSTDYVEGFLFLTTAASTGTVTGDATQTFLSGALQ